MALVQPIDTLCHLCYGIGRDASLSCHFYLSIFTLLFLPHNSTTVTVALLKWPLQIPPDTISPPPLSFHYHRSLQFATEQFIIYNLTFPNLLKFAFFNLVSISALLAKFSPTSVHLLFTFCSLLYTCSECLRLMPFGWFRA